MDLDETIYQQQLNKEMRNAGLNPKGTLMHEYRRTLTFEQEKLLAEAKNKARKRTMELQTMFPGTLGTGQNRLNAGWIADAMKENKPLCEAVGVD